MLFWGQYGCSRISHTVHPTQWRGYYNIHSYSKPVQKGTRGQMASQINSCHDDVHWVITPNRTRLRHDGLNFIIANYNMDNEWGAAMTEGFVPSAIIYVFVFAMIYCTPLSWMHTGMKLVLQCTCQQILCSLFCMVSFKTTTFKFNF